MEGANGWSWPGAAVPNVGRKQTMDKLRISPKGRFAAPAPTGSRRPACDIRLDELDARKLTKAGGSALDCGAAQRQNFVDAGQEHGLEVAR